MVILGRHVAQGNRNFGCIGIKADLIEPDGLHLLGLRSEAKTNKKYCVEEMLHVAGGVCVANLLSGERY